MYNSWGWRPYVSVAEKRRKAEKAVAKMMKSDGKKISPVRIEGRTITKTFWGKAWCDHLESFSDYENRLPRGRSYVRNGSVVHLALENGKIEALVQGSSLYKVKIDIKPVDSKKWKSILKNCSGKIDSLIELLQGRLSSGVMNTITDKQNGLFPHPKEISLNCSCPDWATMCKHVAAVLYGVGARLDKEPEILFKLRNVDHMELIDSASIKATSKRSSKSTIIEDKNLSAVFGIDIDCGVPATPTTPIKKIRTVAIKKAKTKGKGKTKTKAKAKAKTKGKGKTKAKAKAKGKAKRVSELPSTKNRI